MNDGTAMSFRDGSQPVHIPLAAFADDANLIENDNARSLSIEKLVQKAQRGFTSWNKLLHASGHFMELEKCSCYLSVWDYQEDGYAFTIPPKELGQNIVVQDLQANNIEIKQLPSDKSQKLLGVMKNPMGNQQDEVHRLREKGDKLAIRINMHALSSHEARMAYNSFYLPAMRYSLPVTSINQMDFELIQKNATTSLLASMGFNRHMPREVVYCSPKFQGIGLRHLYDLQGTEGTRVLTPELTTQGVRQA
jgi:hypothetical protein